MKNSKIQLLCRILLLSLLISSCSNEFDSGVSVEDQKVFILGEDLFINNGILNFSSIEAYRDLIENSDFTKKSIVVKEIDKIQKFQSMKNQYFASKASSNSRKLHSSEEEMVVTNDFFSTLLNADGLITIGDYIIKINLGEGTCLVLPIKYESQINDLMAENTNNQNIMIFSVSDDALDMLEEGSAGTINGRTSLFCSDRRADGKEKVNLINYSDEGASYDYRVDAKHVYQEAAVYFSLLTELKHMDRPQDVSPLTPWSQASTEIYVEYYFKWKQRCRSGDTEDRGSKETLWDNKLNHRAYERTRGLAKIQIESRYIYLERNVSTGGVDRQLTIPTIKDGY